MSFFEFPHTRTYDTDLGWLIKDYDKLLKNYNSLVSWMNEHRSQYNTLNEKVIELEYSIKAYIKNTNEKLAEFEAHIDSEIYRQVQFAMLQIHGTLSAIMNHLMALQSEVKRNRIEAHSDTIAFFNLSNELTDAKIQHLIDTIPDLTTVNVFNPIRGEDTSIQIAIDDLYDFFRSNGITAYEYDISGITASEYDNLELTAIEYDRYGLYYLELAGYIKNPFHYMASPFTGEITTLQTVITELAALHKLYALTASEYDDREILAEDYDALEISAYNYDWYSTQYIS